MVPHLWPIVLAAGAGRRLAEVTGGMPKQFFRPIAGQSLLGMTLARVAPLASPERTVIIVDESHRPLLDTYDVPRGTTVLFQPADRGTATGVLMSLMPVLDASPHDVVMLTPADHAVTDGDAFRRGVRAAVDVAQHAHAITLFAVEPSDASPDLGWVMPDHRNEHLAPVTSFIEKPDPALAQRLLEQGAVWNTMVVVGRAMDVRALYKIHLPELATVFDTALRLDGEAERTGFLARAYQALPPRDFSRDVLERARRLFVYTWPASIGWSDLGTPERLHRWLDAGAA